MPIHKESEIDGHPCFHVEFGVGDIGIVDFDGVNNKGVYNSGVSFRTEKPRPIGTYNRPELVGVPVASIRPDLIFTFTKPESIDGLIESLQEAKNALLEAQNQDQSNS